MKTYKHQKKPGIITLICLIFLISLMLSNCKHVKHEVNLSLEQPGLGFEDNTLFIAAPLVNTDSSKVHDVKVESIHLGGLAASGAVTFPIDLGTINAGRPAVIQASFSSTTLNSHQSYKLTVEGEYRFEERNEHFSASREVKLPPKGSGSAVAGKAQASPQSVKGAPYPHQSTACCEDGDRSVPPTPIGVLRGTMKPVAPSAALKPAVPGTKKINFEQQQPKSGDLYRFTQGSPDNDLVFVTDASFGTNTGFTPDDPSGASGGGFGGDKNIVLASGNTYAALSLDDGSTFAQLDPTTIFPNTADGGICCDQSIHYTNTVDRFFWLMQFKPGPTGSNRLRLASASPADLASSGGTAWTYWDLTSALFNLGNQIMDYPDISVGDNYLYVSVDASPGLLVARIPLSELASRSTIHIDYTNPSDDPSAYGVHMVQNPGDEIFWAGHPSNSLLRVFSFKEGSDQYYWRDVKINSYPSGVPSATSPDGTDWLASFFSGGPGGVRANTPTSDELWFEWCGIKGGGFPQTHVQIARIRHSDFSLLEQTQIWNPDYAFAYASFAFSIENSIGVALAFGGGSYYGSPAVGILGDNVFYYPVLSGGNRTRFGDYSTVRTAFPNTGLFSATVYAINKDQSYDPRYILFGRSRDVNPPPISSIWPPYRPGGIARAR